MEEYSEACISHDPQAKKAYNPVGAHSEETGQNRKKVKYMQGEYRISWMNGGPNNIDYQ